MSDYKKIILKNSPVPGAVPLADFLDFGELALNYADKKLYYKELGGGIVVHETPYIDIESSQNSIVKRNGDGSGVFNGLISDISDPDLYAIDASHDSGVAARIISSGNFSAAQISSTSGIGAQISSNSGIGANINSTSGIGSIISSGSSTAAVISSNSSTYHAEFGNITTNNSSAIERIRGAFVWFYNTFKGRLQTSNITADRNWTLPNLSGTIVLDSSEVTGKTIFVDATSGTDTRTNLTKYSLKPYATISAAVEASSTDDLIYVCAGTYTISSQISLNTKGHLYFAPGTTVNIASGIVAFSYSQNNIPIYIKGAADFVLAGSAGVLTMPSGNAVTAVAFECNTIYSLTTVSGTLFNCSIGALSVDAKVIQLTPASINATVFNITGTGKVTTRAQFVYCGVFVNGAGVYGAQINADIWTLITYNTTAGIAISSITTNFRIVNYTHVGVGVAFNWTENTVTEGHGFQGITWSSNNSLPNITFDSSAGSTSNKLIRLNAGNILRYASTNSLSSNVPINVATYGTFASVPATSNITFKIGSFTVDTDVNSY